MIEGEDVWGVPFEGRSNPSSRRGGWGTRRKLLRGGSSFRTGPRPAWGALRGRAGHSGRRDEPTRFVFHPGADSDLARSVTGQKINRTEKIKSEERMTRVFKLSSKEGQKRLHLIPS